MYIELTVLFYLFQTLCFMRVDRLCVYTDASITVYDYYNYGTLLVSPFTCVYTVRLYIVVVTGSSQ